MKTSVALCTYNGEKFLREQIDSILQQSVAVDEIIVCDDRSTDATPKILAEYAAKFPDIFKIHINENNLRSVKNFEKAISLCTHDLIFLSDQDDIWEQNKVAVFLDYFKKYPSVDAICSSGFAIDDFGQDLKKRTIWEVPQLLRKQKIPVDYFRIIAYIENIATGAGMAFRKKILPKIIPFPVKNGFHHDEWIALVTAHTQSFMMIDEKLFRYRIHTNQQVGGVVYKNDEATARRLTEHFNMFSKQKTFSQYKKFLKRLSQSYHKHKALSENAAVHQELSQDIMKKAQKLYWEHREFLKKKYPLKFFILNLADTFSNKRKI